MFKNSNSGYDAYVPYSDHALDTVSFAMMRLDTVYQGRVHSCIWSYMDRERIRMMSFDTALEDRVQIYTLYWGVE